MRVTTASTYSNTINSYINQQGDLAKIQKQIATGLKYDNFADIAKDGQTRHILDFTSSLSQLDTYKNNNSLLTSRLNATDAALSQVQDITTKAIQAMTLKRSADGANDPLEPQLRAMLQQLSDQLNTSTDGRYLFAGADTNVQPVEDLDTVSNISSTGTVTANYYNGDNTDLVQNISKNVTLQYNIKANDPAFQNLIGAINLAIKAERNHSDSNLAAAIDMANQAQVSVSDVRSKVGSNLTTISQVGAEHENFKTYLSNTLSNTVNTDTAEASIQLSLDQSILTASFQAFARVSNLSLGNYLK